LVALTQTTPAASFRRDVEREVEVLGPEGRGEPVARVVGQLHGLRRRAECAGDEDGAEDLFLHQRCGGGQAGDQRRRVEAALVRHVHGGAVDLALGVGVDHAGDRRVLHRVHHGAHVDAFVERVADAELVHPRLEPGVEILRDAFLHEQPGARAADLPLVEPDGIDEAFDRAVDIGVVEDDVGGFAAQLERQGLARTGGGLTDLRPTAVEPVKAILAMPGCSTMACPVAPSPVTMLTTPLGSPASRQMSAKRGAR
jgi:hypothetical protein